MHEFRIREEEERARALVARVGIRAALLGGLLATIGGVAAVLVLRWIDPRPVVTVRDVERLISALAEIKRLHRKDPVGLFDHEYIDPDVTMSPEAAFYAKKTTVPLKESLGRIAGEFVMSYPPGIPILAPGERVTPDILEHIEFAKAKGCFMTGPQDMNIDNIQVVE